jgi:hypothetical protein
MGRAIVAVIVSEAPAERIGSTLCEKSLRWRVAKSGGKRIIE